MKRALLLSSVAISLAVTAVAAPRKPPEPKLDKAAACYALGRSFGISYWALNDGWRAKAALFERYCTDKPGEGPQPSDEEIARLHHDLVAFARAVGERPLVDYQKLQKETENLQEQEGKMLQGIMGQ